AAAATQKMAHPQGELGAATAATAAGVVYCLSTLSTTSLEEVATAQGVRWFQLYVFKDRGITTELVDRAEAAGYQAIVLTVDTPILGRRERDFRNAFGMPAGFLYENLVGPLARTGPVDVGQSALAEYFSFQLDHALTLKDLEWLASHTRLPVLVKGVVRPDDARRSLSAGARGVIVSNHGGRQLDYSIATLDALPAVVDEVGGEVPVLLDGGVRRGTDVLKALALGARSVMIGRPYLWALAGLYWCAEMATPSMASTHLAQSGSRSASGSPAGLCWDLRSVAIVDAVRAALVQSRALRLAFILTMLCEFWLICSASVSCKV